MTGKNGFDQVLQCASLPPAARKAVAQAVVEIEVDEVEQSVLLSFEDRGLEKEWLDTTAKCVAQLLGVAVKVKCVSTSAVRKKEAIGANDVAKGEIEKTWPGLGEALKDEFPFLQGLTEELSYFIDDSLSLTINIPSSFVVKMLEGKRERLEQVVAQVTGSPVAVKLVADARDTSWQAAQRRRKEEEQRYLSQLLQGEDTHPPEHKTNQLPFVVYGKEINGEPIAIEEITGTRDRVIVEGKLVKWEAREVKSGRLLFSLVISNQRDSLAVKVMASKEQGEGLKRAVEGPSVWLRAQGSVEEDRYSEELAMWAKDITAIPPKRRQDDAAEKRVELHLHTQMSALDASTGLRQLFQTVRDWGHDAVAITDHGVVQAFPEAYSLGKKYGIKVIYGVEGYLVDDLKGKGKACHVIILARNQEGLQDLYRLVSDSHLHYFHGKPRIPREILRQNRQNLVVGSACEAGELIQAYLQGVRGAELTEVARFYDYLEIQPWENNGFLVREGKMTKESLLEMNQVIVELGQNLGMPVVASGDVHFLEPEDSLFRCILMTAQGYSDAQHQPPLYLRTTDEMLAEFSYLGDHMAKTVVVDNPRAIAAAIERVRPIPDGLHAPVIPGADEQIRTMAKKRARELYGVPLPPAVNQRLERELQSIIDNGFAVIYLIAHKLVAKSLADGYLVGSRGSVGSSFAATMCGITEVNPLAPHYRCPHCLYNEFIDSTEVASGFDLPQAQCPQCGTHLIGDGHDIPFEVFMGFEGDKVPDIDLNFSGEYQPQIHKYTEELFGKDRVFRAGTISTIAERTAYGFVKGYLSDGGLVRRNVEVERLVSGCTGIKRTTGQHPGGLMILPADRDIAEFTPLQYPADAKGSGVITTHFDYHSISSRLLKLDLLGHDDPTAIRMLTELTGLETEEIPFNDQETMAIFSGTGPLGYDPHLFDVPIGTVGIPEFGTRFVRQMLADTNPTTFAELVRISGLSHGTDVWLNNAQELVRSGKAVLGEVISTRDDIMTYLRAKGVPAQDAFSIMERVRKGKGLSEGEEKLMAAHQVPRWYIESCQKIKYMFPKAHAVAYVMMAVRIAYFKVHHPAAFYATYFSVRADDFDVSQTSQGLEGIRRHIGVIDGKGNEATQKEKNLIPILEVALEMYARGIKFLPISLSNSSSNLVTITDDGLLPPFQALPGLGQRAAHNIVAAREDGYFTSVEDLRVRARLSRTVIETLRENGCLQGLPETDQLVLFAE